MQTAAMSFGLSNAKCAAACNRVTFIAAESRGLGMHLATSV